VIVAAFPSLDGLFLLALYCIPTNSILPFPHEPGVLYVAQFYDPLEIAIAATVGSIVVSFADYAMVEYAMKRPRMSAAASHGLFGWAVKSMKRWPFAIIVLFSFLPLPIAVVRVLAPASGYPLPRYILAQIVGRMPRFYALAWLGKTVRLPIWGLAAMFIAMAVLFWWNSRKPPIMDVHVDDP
jgi:membrane protein YqaA with SNARE-associated domain